MAFTYWDLGSCNCTGPTFTQTFLVTGCNAIGYPGLTVSVYTASGGTLLASGTTDGSGQVTLSWPDTSPATRWVVVTGQSARFLASAQSLTMTTGGTTTIGLAIATGYHCLNVCLQPAKDTLVLTDAVTGTLTVTYSTRTVTLFGGGGATTLTGWWGTLSYNYPDTSAVPGCGCDPQPGYPIDYVFSGSQVTLYGWVSLIGFGGGATLSDCPTTSTLNRGYTTLARTAATPPISCPAALDWEDTAAPVNDICIYGSTTNTSHITVTE